MWRKQRLQVFFLLEVLCCLFPANTDVFYKITFYGTKATGNFQLSADGEVSLPTGTQVWGYAPEPMNLRGVNAVSASYIILNINYSVNTAYVLGRILSKQIHILF